MSNKIEAYNNPEGLSGKALLEKNLSEAESRILLLQTEYQKLQEKFLEQKEIAEKANAFIEENQQRWITAESDCLRWTRERDQALQRSVKAEEDLMKARRNFEDLQIKFENLSKKFNQMFEYAQVLERELEKRGAKEANEK